MAKNADFHACTRCGAAPTVMTLRNPKLVMAWCTPCDSKPLTRDTGADCRDAWNALHPVQETHAP